MSLKILVSPEALSQSYFPEKLLHREKEVEQLKRARISEYYVHGQTGTGKTILLKHLIKRNNATQQTKQSISIVLSIKLPTITHQPLASSYLNERS